MKPLLKIEFLGAALSLLASFGGSAAKAAAAESQTVLETQVMPEGCGQAYQEVDRFLDFYEASIADIVVKRGAKAKGVDDLFAVSELRKKMRTTFPNYTQESPIDRLIISQLCQFQKVRSTQIVPGALDKAVIRSSDKDLQEHFISIATRLFRDSSGLLHEELRKKALEKRNSRELASREAEVERARELGRRKIDDMDE